jgi:quercetin dioxygenase-like cupin family protein
MSRYTYPHVIENGAGERLTFARRLPGATGERLEGETLVDPGAGPPMHVHYLQSEGFTVLRGRIGYQRPNEPAQFAGPGDSVAFGPGEGHRFWNAGTQPLHCTAWVEPVGNAEYLLAELFASSLRNGGTRPSIFDAAFLLRRYRSEFRMLDIPAPVQAIVFPIVVVLGRLLGEYARFADAPEPVRR